MNGKSESCHAGDESLRVESTPSQGRLDRSQRHGAIAMRRYCDICDCSTFRFVSLKESSSWRATASISR